jgi:hypothetical protein
LENLKSYTDVRNVEELLLHRRT